MITASLVLKLAPPKCTSVRDRTLLETRYQFQLSKLVHQDLNLPTNHVCSAMRDIDSSATARHVGTRSFSLITAGDPLEVIAALKTAALLS